MRNLAQGFRGLHGARAVLLAAAVSAVLTVLYFLVMARARGAHPSAVARHDVMRPGPSPANGGGAAFGLALLYARKRYGGRAGPRAAPPLELTCRR